LTEYQKREKKKENIYHDKKAEGGATTSLHHPPNTPRPTTTNVPLMPVVTKGEWVNLELIAPLLMKQKC